MHATLREKGIRQELEKNVDRARGTSVSILQFLTDSFFPVGLTAKLFSSGGLMGSSNQFVGMRCGAGIGQQV